MSIHFEKERWKEIDRIYENWWNNRGDSSVLRITIDDAHDPGRPQPAAPLLSQATVADLSWSPEELVDALDWKLSRQEYVGGAFPFVNFDVFGPGVLAAFCGARLDASSGAVWFFPDGNSSRELADIHVRYDPDNLWAMRIKDIYRAGIKRWQGNVLMGMPDLGGCLDVASILRGSEDLLMDLYDDPEEVKRLTREIDKAWKEAYEDFNFVLRPVNPGYSDWTGIYSSSPSYVLQCDFGYMIGTDMFCEFALPSVRHFCEELDHTIYHLDGIGQLKHLDHLLAVDQLQAVQWVYGDGQPSARSWPQVYEQIRRAGKAMQLIGDYEDLRAIEGLGNKVYYSRNVSVCDKEWQSLYTHE